MTKLCFATTGAWEQTDGFGCASLGLAGVCDNTQSHSVCRQIPAKSVTITGTYQKILQQLTQLLQSQQVYAAIVLFGNAGGENQFMEQLQQLIRCPMVGGGAAIDAKKGKGLLSGGEEAALLLFVDDGFSYTTQTLCIHENVIKVCSVETSDPRTIISIDGIDAAQFLAQQRSALGIPEGDFEHMTLSDMQGINAHLSMADGVIKSGRDIDAQMVLRYVPHGQVFEKMRAFYDDPDAIVFGCAGLSGILDKPLDTASLGLFLFGEVCTVDGHAQFGNLMLSKLKITPVK